jgi:SAP domain-containing new25/Domain of unknown function (DUF6434)
MSRPSLEPQIPVTEFRRWYWLKSELVTFCRQNCLGIAGSKPELAARIDAYLSGNAAPTVMQAKRNGLMPEKFTSNTIIGAGWRCSPALGAYFRGVCGAGFRFNAAIRMFIHEGQGKTLGEAASHYKRSVAPGAPRQPIIAQNQYNQHTRDFFANHPNATRKNCLEAWHSKRDKGNV